jgi:hypothetical protein
MSSGAGPGKLGQESDKSIYKIVTHLLDQTRGLQKTTFDQGAEALATGDIAAMRGQISQSISDSMSQASSEKDQARAVLATKNLGRTGFGQNTLAGINLEGKQRTALVQPQIINAIIQRLAPTLTGQAVEIGVNGLGDLADASTRTNVFNQEQRGNNLAGLFQGIGNLGVVGVQQAQQYHQSTRPPAPSTPQPIQPLAVGAG